MSSKAVAVTIVKDAESKLSNVVASVSPAKRAADKQARLEAQTRAAIVLQKFWRANRARKFLDKTSGDHRLASNFEASKKVFRARTNKNKLWSAWKFYAWKKSPQLWFSWCIVLFFSCIEHLFEFLSPWWVVVALRLGFADSYGVIDAAQLSLLFACYMLGFLLARNLRSVVEEEMKSKLRMVLEQDVLALCIRFHRLVTKSELKRISNKVAVVARLVVHHVPSFCFNVVLFVASQVLVFQQSGVLGFIGFAFLSVLALFAYLEGRFHYQHTMQQKATGLVGGHMWAYLSSSHVADSKAAIEQMRHHDVVTTYRYHEFLTLVRSCELVLLASTPLVVLLMGGFVQLEAFHLLSAALYFALSRLQFYFVAQSLIKMYEGTHDFVSLFAFLKANKKALKNDPPAPTNRTFMERLRAQADTLASRYWSPLKNRRFVKELSGGIGLLYVTTGIAVMIAVVLVAVNQQSVFRCHEVALQCLVFPPSLLAGPQPLPSFLASQRFSLSAGCELADSQGELLGRCLSSLYARSDLNATSDTFTLQLIHPSWKQGNEQGFQAQYQWSEYGSLTRRLLASDAARVGNIEDVVKSGSCCDCGQGCHQKIISLTLQYTGQSPLYVETTIGVDEKGRSSNPTQGQILQPGEQFVIALSQKKKLDVVMLSSALGDMFFDTSCGPEIGSTGTIGSVFTVTDGSSSNRDLCDNPKPVELLAMTKAPTTRQPTTGAPTNKPTTPFPTAVPTTPKPTTKAPTQQPTVTPTTARPTTSTPTTTQPTTSAPTTSRPTTSTPTTARPTTLTPTTTQPTSAAPTTGFPTTRFPTTSAPTTKAPTQIPTQSPVTTSPTRTPTTKAPSTRQPTTSQPTTRQPTMIPTLSPVTKSPTLHPTTKVPTTKAPTPPTNAPTRSPTTPLETLKPTAAPTAPTKSPTTSPTTLSPVTQSPTAAPTTAMPTRFPTASPTRHPTTSPTMSPTTSEPTQAPTTSQPTKFPTRSPTRQPTQSPTKLPTLQPTQSPTTLQPTRSPTKAPTHGPTWNPTTASPTTTAPTEQPTLQPTTIAPTTVAPTIAPTDAPTTAPTRSPTTLAPTAQPTQAPTTRQPTQLPTTKQPTVRPTGSPTHSPVTASPTTARPTRNPTTASPTPPTMPGDTISPTTLGPTTSSPTLSPTKGPTTGSPTTSAPTQQPTSSPSPSPTTGGPTMSPSTLVVTTAPSLAPSSLAPSLAPSSPGPSAQPTSKAPTPCACSPCTLMPTPVGGKVHFTALTPTTVLVTAGLTPGLCTKLLGDDGLEVIVPVSSEPLVYFFAGLATSLAILLLWLLLLLWRRRKHTQKDLGIFTPTELPQADSNKAASSMWSPIKYKGASLRKLQKKSKQERKEREIEMTEEPDG